LNIHYIRFEILIAVVMGIYISWDIIPCSPLEVNWRFGETFKAGPLLAIYFYSCLLIGLIIDPENGGEIFLREVGWYSTEHTVLCISSVTIYLKIFCLQHCLYSGRSMSCTRWSRTSSSTLQFVQYAPAIFFCFELIILITFSNRYESLSVKFRDWVCKEKSLRQLFPNCPTIT
jgi:hypothetical protein